MAGTAVSGGPDAAYYFGRVSHVRSGAPVVLRASGAAEQAGVNVPVGPGDFVITASGERLEITFDSGSVLHVSEGARLRVETIGADSISTEKRPHRTCATSIA